MTILYRIYQLFVAAPICLIATLLTAITVTIGCTLGNGHFWGYYPPRWWGKVMVRVLLLPVKVEGRENLEKGQSYVFVSNHQGAYDIFLIYGYLGRNFKWMMKRHKNIIHLHGSEFKKWYDSCNEKKQKKIKEFIRKSYKFIVLGNEWKERIISIEPSANVVVVNNTVSIPEESTFYSTDKLRFLFLGVLIKRKGVHDLLEAINGIPREKLNNVEFIIAGTGDEELNLLNKSKKYNLEKYVNFIGWTDKEKKWQLLQECQCMILPSYNEGLPMAILEAMSYGMPIIATKVGDIPEAVIDSFNGYLFNAGDIDSLKQIIIDFISLNKNEWNKLSSNSKELATEKFSSKEYIETFLVLYSKNNERR